MQSKPDLWRHSTMGLGGLAVPAGRSVELEIFAAVTKTSTTLPPAVSEEP